MPSLSSAPLAFLSLLSVSACSAIATSPHLNPDVLSRTVVLDGLKSPWAISFLSADKALITEKEGGLLLADLRARRTAQVEGLPDDLVDDVRSEVPFDNGGLFDVTIDPDFDDNARVYLSYAAKSAAGRTTKVIRARLQGGRLVDTETLLVAEPYTQGEFFHYGGGLAFGADGKLYVTIGERIYNERDNPVLPIAQNPEDRRGKIYRIDPDGTVPADNPDFGPQAVAGLYAIGIRAAQGIVTHPETGQIWFSEHGSVQGDEINRLEAGANYGWPIVTTGTYRNDDYTPPDIEAFAATPPAWSWKQTVAPTGLTFYYGDEFPDWRGDLLVAGLSTGSLWRIDFFSGNIVSAEELFANERVRSRDVAVSPDGALYVLTDTLLLSADSGRLEYTGEPSGQLLRIEKRTP